ncbi:MAG: divalent metal cation transporter [Bacteroidetes bacterium]|nr:divalent metal cation transporter [Bacteroidota bacterium]MDA1119431.1 divalent metal cation transporter [Bacteroidota bacterium]
MGRIKTFLPGIFLFGFTIGTGSVTAMAKAGTDYGMALLWTIFLSCIITGFMIHLFGKFAIVTGRTALSAFAQYIHPGFAIFFIITLTAHVCGSVIGVMGIISDISFEWSKNIVDGGVPPLYFAIFYISLVYAIFLNGKMKVFEKVLAVLAGIMTVCFVINFFILMPPIEEIGRGLIPGVPTTENDDNTFLIIASMVGTTVFSGLFVLRTTLVKEAGWTLADLKTQRNDAIFAGFMMFAISGAIMAAAAGTLHVQGAKMENVTEMIVLLEPVAGFFAVAVFTLGLIAAGVSSQFPNVSLLPWLLNDYIGRKTDVNRMDYRIMVLVISLLGLIVPVFNAKPIPVMITSQAFGALVLPVTVGCILYMGNRKDLMKEYSFSWVINIALVLILVFAAVMSYMSYNGLIAQIKAI